MPLDLDGWNGWVQRRSKKEEICVCVCVCVCVYLIDFIVQQKLAQHCKAATIHQ